MPAPALLQAPLRPGCRPRGFTLVELMIGLAIAAWLLTVGVPFMGEMVTNSRLREGGNAIYAETLFAQSEAIKRNTTVRLVVNGSSLLVRDLSAGEPGVQIREAQLPAPVAAGAAANLDFGSDGRPVNFATYAVNLGASGVTCSADQRCPGLRVEAGGAIRICSNHLSGCT